MKVIFKEGPETIRTDEGDLQRGIPADVSDALGARLLASGHKFEDISEPKKEATEGIGIGKVKTSKSEKTARG